MDKKKVLITGAMGAIGRSLTEHLRDHFTLRLLVRRPFESEEEVVWGQLEDFDAMLRACEGMDAVVHMAAHAGERDFPSELLPVNILGTYHVFEAARQKGVKTVVFASTNHVIGGYERDHYRDGVDIYVTDDMPVRPDSNYGVTKAYGEALGRYYTDFFDLSVICLRIGSFQPEEHLREGGNRRILSTWLSHRDCAQMVRLAIDHENLGFQIFNAISNNTRRYWDLERAKQVLGYAPEDDAERFAEYFEEE